MVQQISALIVQPAVDATKYTAGAHDKVAADNAMAASSRTVSVAINDTSGKISVAGDALARLSRRYIDGRADEQNFVQGLNQLNRSLATGKINIEGAERILIGMNQRLGLTANAADLAAKGQMSLAAAVERANVQIARQASDLAAAEAANRRMQAANSNVISDGARRAAGFNAGQQLQDIAMMSLVGQDPRVLALQQGPQLATAIQQGGGLAALGSGLASLLSMTTLLTIGFTAATAATIQWAMKGRDGAKSLNEALKDHSETLRLLKGQYGELGEAAKTVGNAGGLAFTEASARNVTALVQAQFRAQQDPLMKTLTGSDGWGRLIPGRNTGSDAIERLRKLSGDEMIYAAPVDALIKSVRDGSGDLAAFDEHIDSIFNRNLPKAANPAQFQAIAESMKTLAHGAFEVNGQFAAFADPINKLKLDGVDGISTFNAEVEKIGRNRGIQDLADKAILAGKEFVDLADKARELEKILQRIDREETRPGLSERRALGGYVNRRSADLGILNGQFDADQQMARARTNAERLAAAEAQVRARAREDGDTGGGLQARVDRALAQERTRQEVEARDATIQRSQALERTLQQQRLELDLIGKTGVEQAKLRFEFERMQELREQAARTGAPINEKEVAAIKAAAEAMAQYADAIARAKLAGELQFEREQLFRSPQDQQIASRLRGAGLPVDLNGPLAQQMRDNQTFADMKGLASGFLNDFKSGIVSSGGDIGEALGNAIQNALLKSADMYLSDVSDHLATMFARSMTGQAAPFGTPDGFAQMLGIGIKGSSSGRVLGSANDNLDIAGYIRQAAVARDIDPNIALRVARSEGLAPGIWQSNVIRNGIREPSYGPFQLLKGGAGTGFPSGLGNAFQSATGLDPANPANIRPGIDFALNHAAGNGWGAWYGAKAAGVGNWEGLQGASTKAVGSLDRLATSSIDTANDLRSGLGNLGNALNQFPSAPGGGGLLGNLLGGLNSTFSGSRAFNWLSSNPGSFINFYADGTEDAPPGWAWVGERGPELMRMRGGETIRSSQRSAEMVSSQSRSQAPITEIKIINQDGAQVKSTRKRKNASGGDLTELVVGVVKQSIADGEMDGAFGGRFGAKPRRVVRGAVS